MYKKAYGILETLAPVHVGASAGEETGNLNLIFRDQFTQTGIIPGSSIRGRFRADMRNKTYDLSLMSLESTEELPSAGKELVIVAKIADSYHVRIFDVDETMVIDKGSDEFLPNEMLTQQLDEAISEQRIGNSTKYKLIRQITLSIGHTLKKKKINDEQHWYGHEAVEGREDGGTTEALVKFEYASLVWLPVFCPGQPIVWVSCPWLLRRYKQIAGIKQDIPAPYTAPRNLQARPVDTNSKVLFFNLGFLEIEHEADLTPWIPDNVGIRKDSVVVVDNNDIAMIHDMALYRQSRVRLDSEEKKVATGAFFNVEALPESSIMVFPVALKETGWQPFDQDTDKEMYFGGLESIGFGRCNVTLQGDY